MDKGEATTTTTRARVVTERRSGGGGPTEVTMSDTTTAPTTTAATVVSRELDDVVQPWNTVELELTSGKVVRGVVFAIDTVNKLVFVETPTETKDLCDTSVVNMTSVVKRKLIHKPEPHKQQQQPPLPPLTTDYVTKREKEAFKQCEVKLLNHHGPPGLSPDIHHIFENLNKTMSLTWKGENMEDAKLGVIIKPPYQPDDVVGRDNSTDSKAVQRVKDMLRKLWEKTSRR